MNVSGYCFHIESESTRLHYRSAIAYGDETEAGRVAFEVFKLLYVNRHDIVISTQLVDNVCLYVPPQFPPLP